MGAPGNEGISFDKQPPQGPPPGYGPPPGSYQQGGYQQGYGSAYPVSYGPPPGYGGYYPGPPPGPKPSSNIGWAIAAIFLFWPLCIPAFIFATRVDSAWYAGDFYGAQKASSDAKKYGMIGVIVGGSIIALYILLFVAVFAVAGSSA